MKLVYNERNRTAYQTQYTVSVGMKCHEVVSGDVNKSARATLENIHHAKLRGSFLKIYQWDSSRTCRPMRIFMRILKIFYCVYPGFCTVLENMYGRSASVC